MIISTYLVTVVIRYLVKIWHDFYPIFDRDACRSSPTIHFVNLFPLLVIWVFSTQMTNNWFESYKDWGLENNTNLNFFTCISPDYMAHDISKEFWKNSHFENVTAVFLQRCQNSLRWEISLICHWNIDSWKQKLSFLCVMVPKNGQNII